MQGHDSRIAGCSACSSSTAVAVSGSSTRRWSTRRVLGRRSCLTLSTWRIEEITRDQRARLAGAQCPGCRAHPGRTKGWERPYELGQKIGAASRELSALREAKAVERLRGRLPPGRARRPWPADLPARAAGRDRRRSQRSHDRRRTASATRSGDWRVCILTPFGGRVHAPWAMAIAARLREAHGVEAQSIWSDDGIALHFPKADATPDGDDLMHRSGRGLRIWSSPEVGDTALFGATLPRERRAVAPDPAPPADERTPLWQQRLEGPSRCFRWRASTARSRSFLGTYRECLQDIFDLPALRRPACSSSEDA